MKWLAIPISLLMQAAMWRFFDNVVVPSQQAEAAAHNQPRGNLSDLYPRWLGARELILHGHDPYGASTTTEIQKGYWGRAIDRNNPHDPSDEARFAYPLYVVFLLAPSITLPFETVQRLYIWVVSAVWIVCVWLWFDFFGQAFSALTRIVTAILLLGSYPFVMGSHLQQLSLFVVALLGAAAAAAARQRYWVAGLMLAITTIKPQLSAPIAAWLLFWTVWNWRERKYLLISFVASMAVLCAASEILLPGWIPEWLNATSEYMRYAPLPPAHVEVIFGKYLSRAVTALIVFAVGVLCWRARHDSPATNRFRFLASVIPAMTFVLSPMWHSYDGVLLFPAVLLLFEWKDQFRQLNTFAGAVACITAGVLAWQWIAAGIISTLALTSPLLAQRLQIFPWLPVLFGPTLTLVSLTLVARVKLSGWPEQGEP